MTLQPRSGGPRAAEPSVVRVVLVDDSPEFRHLVGLVLRRDERFALVAEADDGVAGVAAVEDHRPDLVVTDLQMPGMDGIELTTWLRARYPDLPVVMFTGFPGPEIIQRAFDAGVSAFLEKRAGVTTLPDLLYSVIEADLDSMPSRATA